MKWDIFCNVVDNFGDVGVCWRLVSGLAERGQTCRLWISDVSALRWMAPHVNLDGMGHPGVEVLPWLEADDAGLDDHLPGDVIIEAFACHLPDRFVQKMQRSNPPVWINLEYFSAQAYVERSHGLLSPVMFGPGQGLRKYFFFPGVNSRTGGLMQPTRWLKQADHQQEPSNRQAVLDNVGVKFQSHERIVTVFCYDHAPLHTWLDALSQASLTTCHVLLMQGAAQRLGKAWRACTPLNDHIKLHSIPALPQSLFDALLSAADFNIVRGEDSAVSALWAGHPHIWHIYHQDDESHAAKLEAFMSHWMKRWPESLRMDVMKVWRAFNGLDQTENFRHMNALWNADAWLSWQSNSRISSKQQAQESDLITRLLAFVDGLSR